MITIPKPGFDRVLLIPDPAKDKSPGGILLPDAKPDLKGTVVAIGEGKMLPSGVVQPMSWKLGDRVLYSEYNTVEVEVGGEKLLSMREENIIMAIENRRKRLRRGRGLAGAHRSR